MSLDSLTSSELEKAVTIHELLQDIKRQQLDASLSRAQSRLHELVVVLWTWLPPDPCPAEATNGQMVAELNGDC